VLLENRLECFYSIQATGQKGLDTAQPNWGMMATMEAETRVEAPFGDWLMRELRERGMSLSDVARLAQCDYTYLWRLVNVGRARGRQYRRPSYDMAERVGRALGATHEALTAAGYLPAENVQNSRVVDALDRVERQLTQLRQELAEGTAAVPVAGTESRRGGAALPLLDGESWPEDPDAALERIELPEWLAAKASWAVRIGRNGAAAELRPGDLALIRKGKARPGQLALVLRDGKPSFVTDAPGGAAVGTVTAVVRRLAD
jgi:transcriptional regulator with XRE-family HTH domain